MGATIPMGEGMEMAAGRTKISAVLCLPDVILNWAVVRGKAMDRGPVAFSDNS